MLDTLRRRSSAKRAAAMTAQAEENLANLASFPPPGGLKPYDTPLPNGKCYMSEMPAEVLSRIFLKLDRASLTRCYRLCKDLHEFLTTNSAISLHHTLLCNSLILNPASLVPPSNNPQRSPPSRAELLASLRERLTRFRNFKPKRTTDVQFKEDKGSLYEYLEGVLMRGIKPKQVARDAYVARELAVYDARQLGEWEDEESATGTLDRAPDVGQSGSGVVEVDQEEEEEMLEEEQIARDIRREKKFDFDISEFAVDPGQDLLVLVEVRKIVRRGEQPRAVSYKMLFHLFSLETFEYHPMAKQPILEWPETLTSPRIELGFQICDDGLFVLKHHRQLGPASDTLHGWQWTTGRLGMNLGIPGGILSFESFVLLSPSAFVVPTIIARLDPFADTHEDLHNPDDLIWTHAMMLFAFPPFSSVSIVEGEPMPPPHTATHVATIDLPLFTVDLRHNIPPPRMSARTDPPPRYTLPTHPRDSVNPFAPTPESGLLIIEFHCQLPHENPHYVLCMQKTTLIQYLPAPTSPVLTQAFSRPAPVVPWTTIAPHVRMFGPDMDPSSWVCYVYQNRYVNIRLDVDREDQFIRLYDFDPLRVRKEICDRKYGNPPVSSGETIEEADETGDDETEAGPAHSPTRSAVSAAMAVLFPGRRPSTRSSTGRPKAKGKLDGDRDGIILVSDETKIERNPLLPQGLKTGSEFPYIYVERRTRGDNALIDGERVVIVHEDEVSADWNISTRLEVMEF